LAERRGKRFSGEELELMVLGLLNEQPQHGYQLIRSFADKSGDAYTPSPGVLYPLLAMLQDKGLVDDVQGERKGRKVFDLTAEGKAEVANKAAEIAELFARLATMAEQSGRTDPAPVRRAMMNLRAASLQRLSGKPGDETAFAIAAILDEAAQKIERL
jgi:DNA-binding PadR family transcriptional regulator